MNFLNFGTGKFFGLIIPGAFLLINLIFYAPAGITENTGNDESFPVLEFILANLEDKTLIIPLLFVISYILGFTLRLIRPTLLEKFAFYMFSFLYAFRAWRAYIKEDRLIKYKWFWRAETRWVREDFPYIDWVYEEYLNKSANSYDSFYQTLLREEYDGQIERLKGHNFINQCKLYIYDKSSFLRSEILFNEGLVRLMAGMTYAMILSFIFFLIVGSVQHIALIYVLISLALISKLRTIRRKEVLTILDAFFFTKTRRVRSK